MRGFAGNSMQRFAKFGPKLVKKEELEKDALVDFIGLGDTKPGKEKKHREEWYDHLFNDRENRKGFKVTLRAIKDRLSTPYSASRHMAEIMARYPGNEYLFYANACFGAGLIGISHKFNKITGCEIDELSFDALEHNIKSEGLGEKVNLIKGDCLKLIQNDAKFGQVYFDPVWVKNGEVVLDDHLTISGTYLDEIVQLAFDTISSLKCVFVKYPLKNCCKFEGGKSYEIEGTNIAGFSSNFKLHVIVRKDKSP